MRNLKLPRNNKCCTKVFPAILLPAGNLRSLGKKKKSNKKAETK